MVNLHGSRAIHTNMIEGDGLCKAILCGMFELKTSRALSYKVYHVLDFQVKFR